MTENNLTNQEIGENLANYEKKVDEAKSRVRTPSGFLRADISNNLGNKLAVILMIVVFGSLALLIFYFLLFPAR